ncbi:MAG: hypothetical protein ACRD0M_03780, partial [Acidimicrobiales bacterium]
MADATLAPWALAGEAVVGWVARCGALAPALPAPLRPLPGPVLVVASHYADSPVGPFLELAVGWPGRLGLRAGLHLG